VGYFLQTPLPWGSLAFSVSACQIPGDGYSIGNFSGNQKVAPKYGIFLFFPQTTPTLQGFLTINLNLLSGGFPGGCCGSGACEEAVRSFWLWKISLLILVWWGLKRTF